jgi:hypothetical protein
MYVRVPIFTYSVTWVVRWNWWLILLMCLLCLNFKLNTGNVVDCDWLDQVGCYGDRSDTACFMWNLCSFMYMQMIKFHSCWSKQSSMVMWILLCNHRIYNSPATLQNNICRLFSPFSLLFPKQDLKICLLFHSVGKNKQLIKVQMCMCVFIYIYINTSLSRKHCSNGCCAICTERWGFPKTVWLGSSVCSQWGGQMLALLDNVISHNLIISVSLMPQLFVN